jgi:uncharacterized protein DUF6924
MPPVGRCDPMRTCSVFPVPENSLLVRTDFTDDAAWQSARYAASAENSDAFRGYGRVVDEDVCDGADETVAGRRARRAGPPGLILPGSGLLSPSVFGVIAHRRSASGVELETWPAPVAAAPSRSARRSRLGGPSWACRGGRSAPSRCCTVPPAWLVTRFGFRERLAGCQPRAL